MTATTAGKASSPAGLQARARRSASLRGPERPVLTPRHRPPGNAGTWPPAWKSDTMSASQLPTARRSATAATRKAATEENHAPAPGLQSPLVLELSLIHI